MDERSVTAGATELAAIQHAAPGDRTGSLGLEDSRALSILTTEHWSLLSARSLAYSEAFARAGMFLAFLSATLVALGLVATATGFSDAFLAVSAGVLSLDLFVGLATLARVSSASMEDIRYLQGMNRLRHAYHDLVPGLDAYFITSAHDDPRSVLVFFGPPATGPVASILHGLSTTSGLVGTITAVIAGTLVGVLAILQTHDTAIGGVAGVVGFALAFALITLRTMRKVTRFFASLDVRFPASPSGSPGAASRR